MHVYVAYTQGSEKALGGSHPSTLTSLNNLAGCLRSMGEFTDALKLYHAALEGRERAFGSTHPSSLTAANNLAECLDAVGCSQGRPE